MASNKTQTPDVTNATTTKACECGLWMSETGDQLTGCHQQVSNSKKMFLPGHDAKLKGALIRAKHAGIKVRRADDQNYVTAVAAASRFGFAAMVANATPRTKKAADVATVASVVTETLTQIVAKAEAEEVLRDEAEVVKHVRNVRTRKAAPATPRTRKAATKTA